MVLSVCLALGGTAEPQDIGTDFEMRVLDAVFPLDPGVSSYFARMTLRFSDSDTQLVAVTHLVYPPDPRGRAELISYSIAGLGNGSLPQFISKMLAQDPKVTAPEIAAKLKVHVTSSPIGYEALERFVNELKSIRISPILQSRVAVDEYSGYEFWYDTGQESVHYTLTGPFEHAPQDQLVQWMIRFRASVPDLLKAGSEQKP